MPPKRKAAASAAVAAAAAVSAPSATNFNKMKVAELVAECKARKLDSSGKKSDLVQRLEDDEMLNAGSGAVKCKEEDVEDAVDETKMTMKDKLKALAEKEKGKIKSRKVDSFYPRVASGRVFEDYDCMLNQTNIGANNNKYYVIQLIADGGKFYVWNRWGRVGESGANAMKGPYADGDAAVKEFKKKFKEKTKNDWEERANFVPASGKYTLLEMDEQDSQKQAELEEKLASVDAVDAGSPVKKIKLSTKACTLDSPTQNLIQLIFSSDMFKDAMANMELDVKKMPLGKLSKAQIAKGFEVLEEIETELKANRSKSLQELTSRFYTLIPHNFGRQRPPVISTQEVLQKKMDMLAVLGDIEIAQSLQKDVKKEEEEEGKDIPHPDDLNYDLLNCGLNHIDPKSDTFKVLEQYVEATKSQGYGGAKGDANKILNIWEVDRSGEENRHSEHKSISNRRLLWHGTNIAVVVAILKTGLRIMPHSGGRVGRGIYFASEHQKSAGYVRPNHAGIGIMFLCEVALGKEHHITRDDPSLTAAPKGFDSVIAKGRTEPDPTKDTKINIGGRDVTVPQGKPLDQAQYASSSFWQSEYLIYKESQCRIRYLLTMKNLYG